MLCASIVPTLFGPTLEQPIFAENESNCSAIAELMWGAAVGQDDFVLLKVDLGVGGPLFSTAGFDDPASLQRCSEARCSAPLRVRHPISLRSGAQLSPTISAG
ncbi:ROK family protein [Mesorhizobium sp. M0228]|uniref:ROK family protein n=1 Tax=unclassified Mesorhizobium TaxID=325217 RepID=UPI00333C489F